MSAGKSSGNVSTYDRVVDLLNSASLVQDTDEKLLNLKTVEELILRKEPNLLDNFFDEFSAFQTDRHVDVKKCVVHFLEEAGKVDVELLPKIVFNLHALFTNENVAVIKRVILSVAEVYKSSFQWILRSKQTTEPMKQAWQGLNALKAAITELLDSDNDGIRTHSIKFLESIVITLSYKTEDSLVPAASAKDPNLADIPEDHSYFKPSKLLEEGKAAFEALVKYQSTSHISSVNLMTCMSSMTNIVKQRPMFIEKVIQAFESLHVNLPPTLSKSQVSSVRKNLKMQMLTLLRLGASQELQSNITTLLTDLGATQSEVIKNMPRSEELRKRKAEALNSAAKKSKVEIESSVADDDDDDVDIVPLVTPSSKPSHPPSTFQRPKSVTPTVTPAPKPAVSQPPKVLSAIDITTEDLVPRMTPQNVADLVLLSMVMLPSTMPASFQATYTPIAAAGTTVQIRHMTRLLATQLTAAGFGKGVSETKQQEAAAAAAAAANKEAEEMEESNQKQTIATVVGGSVASMTSNTVVPEISQTLPPANILQSTRRGAGPFKLTNITKPMKPAMSETVAVQSLKRILSTDGSTGSGNQSMMRVKIITGLVSQFGGELSDVLLDYIFADLRGRIDLAMAWIYHEYSVAQGYDMSSSGKTSLTGYDRCLCQILLLLLDRPDQKEGLFCRVIMDAPLITSNAIEVLKRYCQEDSRIYLGMTTLRDLILNRPSMKNEFLDILLQFTSNEKTEVRSNAIRVSKKLHEREDLRDYIEKHALRRLRQLLHQSPPEDLTSNKSEEKEEESGWTEESIKLCLYLYLGLLPIKHNLIHELALVYTETSADIKRAILRILETPVKGMGMESPELLLLVENCPRGAETLVTRVIHILTDKAVPSPELVDRVRDLYHKRVADVRFLIPVLNGLTKKEIVSTLPKLIKLNPAVVKEVFNRLLGLQNQISIASPITPTELLLALHTLDPNKVDMKTIIKACNMCFVEKDVYTQEVLAMVIQQLLEMSPLPTLLMRTVIQALVTYPKLIGFVMNVMQRLIVKQVWKQKKVWEGFVKCCQRTKPQSFQVLLQLPANQLKDVFLTCPDLREPLLQHVQSFPPHQRAHISKTIMSLLEKDVTELRAMEDAKKAEEERIAQQEKLYEKKLEDERRKKESLRQRNHGSTDRKSSIDIKHEVTDNDAFYGGTTTNKPSRSSNSGSHSTVQIKTESDAADNERGGSYSHSSSSRHHKRN